MAKRVFTQTFGVAGAIIEKDGKIVLVQENIKGEDNGKWNQPAGWIEVGEHPLDAVKKEVREETGSDFKPSGIIGIYSLFRNDLDPVRHAIKIVFRGEIVGEGERDKDEISEVKLFTPEEIYQMPPEQLRDLDIKDEVRDYLAGKNYPLDIIKHTAAE